MTDTDMEKSFRIAFGWCVLFFALLVLSGFMALQIPCVVWCDIGLALYALWIVLYGLKRLRG